MGKKNLETALVAARPRASSPDVTFKTHWRPFFLMPQEVWRRGVATGEFPRDAQTRGINKLDYYNSKFGGPARVTPMFERLRGVMESVGIDGYSMGGNTGPTIDGHRVATYAGERESLEKQNDFMEALMRAYFTEEKCPADPDVVRAAAKRAGLDADAVDELLANPTAYLSETDEQLQRYARGVSGVPHFIVGDGKRRISLSGAQPPEAFLDAFEELGVVDVDDA